MVLGRSVTAISENCWVLKTNKVDFHMLGQQHVKTFLRITSEVSCKYEILSGKYLSFLRITSEVSCKYEILSGKSWKLLMGVS